MRTITVNQIKTVLDECLRLSSDKVYSVLFVSEMDDYVKFSIESWSEEQMEKGLTYSRRPPVFLVDKNAQRGSRRTIDFGYFDQANIVYDYFEFGYHGDETSKSDYLNAYLNLKNKKGEHHNRDIRLIIFSTLNPAWVNNMPYFGENDSSLFDEIIKIELNKEVFKENYLSRKKSWINQLEEIIKNNDSSDDIEKLKSALDKEKSIYDLTEFVLNHPSFDFAPLVRLEGERDPVTGDTVTEGFSPVDFCNLFNVWDWEKWESVIRFSSIKEYYKKVLTEIIREYQKKTINR